MGGFFYMSPQRPSGPDWQRYKQRELRHWQKHGKGSGKFHKQHGHRWRLDPKNEAGKPRRYSAKSVDVKNNESRDHTSNREVKINGQTSKYADKKKTNATKAYNNGQGKDNHHIVPAGRVDNGLGKKYGYPLPESVHKTHNGNGVYLGDDHRNLMGADKRLHKAIHAQYDALDRHLGILDQLSQLDKWPKGKNAMRGFPSQSFAPTTGSEIVDRVNENMQTNGYAATLGVPLDLF